MPKLRSTYDVVIFLLTYLLTYLLLLLLLLLLLTAVDVPSAPLNLRASHVTADSVTLDWTRPRSDGGSAITGYVIERRDPASNYWTRVGSTDQRAKTTHVVGGLRPGAECHLQVLAENDIGVSDPCTLSAPVKLPPGPATPAAGTSANLARLLFT